MKKVNQSAELDVDYIKSRPLTKDEEIALSSFIKQLKTRKKTKTLPSSRAKKKLAA